MSEITTVCPFGCGQKTKNERIEFSNGKVFNIPFELVGYTHFCPERYILELIGPKDEQLVYPVNILKDEEKKKFEDLYYLAIDFFDEGKDEECIKNMQAALDISYLLSVNFATLGDFYRFFGNFEDSLKAYNTQLNLSPQVHTTSPEQLWINKAYVLIQLEREKEAIDFLKKEIESIPEQIHWYKEYDNPKSIEFLQRTEPELFYYISLAYYKLRNNPKTIEYITKSIKILEKNPLPPIESEKDEFKRSWLIDRHIVAVYIFELYGNALYDERRHKEAVEALRRSQEFRDEITGLEKTLKTPEEPSRTIKKEVLKSKTRIIYPFPDMTEDDFIAEIELKLRELIEKMFS